MAQSLIQAFNLLSTDSRVKTIVLTSSTQSSIFCAGADLEIGLSYTQDTATTHRDMGGQVALAIHNCKKPVIAAITGSAVGVGITMTLPCAIRVVSDKAKVGFVFARRGIVMEACSSFFLPRLVGWSRAMHLVTTGAVYRATHKLFGDLFTEIVKPEQVMEKALELAEEISGKTSTVSTTLMRDLMWRGPGTVEETHLLESRVLWELFGGRDKKEGVESFVGKREVSFEGNMEDDKPEVWPWWERVDVKVPEMEKSKL
ncbi:ClpP/crotonase [Glarea lozoyensis ATCC 20868]|uniref:ClpP/crotonase n=1 Tax=Glarea lozoyensis (strain ATCC 20868 / MF5171) TaxID=1116229 RepID=S3D1K5_GLAL2|nr:ClpP/crotonase [Glarea lozoyensis ATCC 20868]EPE32422.1 ClpP/crotonase [Glarea lozoyensis ATCC 20868]